MKRYVKSQWIMPYRPTSPLDEVFEGRNESLEEYVEEPFDLNNSSIQASIADWAEWKLSSSISNSVRNKLKREGKDIYCDNITWSKDWIRFDVMLYDSESNTDKLIDTFGSNLTFDDGEATSYDDVEYIIVTDVEDFLVSNELD